MAKVVLQNTDSPKNSRVDINANFTELYTGQEIVQASAKTTPVDADTVGLIDSAASSVLKYVTWANIKATLKTYFDTLYRPVSLTAFSDLSLATGQVINGKIAVTVASNNITLALKGADGNDPSASNPVYCKIGGVIRSVTAALSVTKNAGTNWCNAGSAELATKEIDYFAYLGYNATDGVVLGFSRIPFANQYSDFSTTTTNEKYCAISTITNAAATDYYNVIGRFAATLSAGAGYTWSVPTFTAINLIQRPIWETRLLDITQVVTGFSSVPTSVYYRYKLSNSNLFLNYNPTTAGTSNATGYTLLAPFKVGRYEDFAIGIAALDNAGWFAGFARMDSFLASSNSIILEKSNLGGTWTASGSKSARFAINFNISI
jgi:hypothetical protein